MIKGERSIQGMSSNLHNLPLVTCLVTPFNEGKYIRTCLNSIVAQTYPSERLEVVIVDGGSTDNTWEIIKEFVQEHKNWRAYRLCERRFLPEVLNLGVSVSYGKYIVKYDSHGWGGADLIARCVRCFSVSPSIKIVGSLVRFVPENFIAEINTLARQSQFGVGGSINTRAEEGYVYSVQCGVYDSATLRNIGMFDPNMFYGEDDELSHRFLQSGYKIYAQTDAVFNYYPRKDLKGAFKQYYNYGIARFKVIGKHPDYASLRHWAPPIFVSGLALGWTPVLLWTPFWIPYFAGIGFYLLFNLCFSAMTAGSRGIRSVLTLALMFFLIHAGYGCGALRRLLFGRREATIPMMPDMSLLWRYDPQNDEEFNDVMRPISPLNSAPQLAPKKELQASIMSVS